MTTIFAPESSPKYHFRELVKQVIHLVNNLWLVLFESR